MTVITPWRGPACWAEVGSTVGHLWVLQLILPGISRTFPPRRSRSVCRAGDLEDCRVMGIPPDETSPTGGLEGSGATESFSAARVTPEFIRAELVGLVISRRHGLNDASKMRSLAAVQHRSEGGSLNQLNNSLRTFLIELCDEIFGSDDAKIVKICLGLDLDYQRKFATERYADVCALGISGLTNIDTVRKKVRETHIPRLAEALYDRNARYEGDRATATVPMMPPGRTSVQMVTWQDFDHLAKHVVWQIRPFKPELVLGVVRGGLPLATVLSYHLPGVTTGTVAVWKQKSEVKVEAIHALEGQPSCVVIASDLITRGRTIRAVVKSLREINGDPTSLTIVVAALYIDPSAYRSLADANLVIGPGQIVDNKTVYLHFPWQRWDG